MMQSLWGYESGNNEYNKLSNAPNPPFDHYDLQDIGVNTHAQIDAHIANSVNPHGTTLTQTTLNVTNLDEETLGGGITINTGTPGPKFSGGLITPVTASTILLTDGMSVGSPSTPLNQFYANYMSGVTPTTYPWATAMPVDFYFVKMGGYCEMNLVTQAIGAITTSTNVVFLGVVPAIMRPTSNQLRIYVTSVTTGLHRLGALLINTSGDVIFGNDYTSTGGFTAGNAKEGMTPTTVGWTV